MAKVPNFTFNQTEVECFDCGQEIGGETLSNYPDTTLCLDCINGE